eukprot:jgi/Mesen1/4415/ME000225S03405
MATIKKSHANDHSNFRSLDPPPPLDEPLGGYIFVCNNDTMEEDLQRDLFGLPQKYQNSVRGIQTGMPLFLYNYTTRELHGIFEVRVKLREKKAPLTEAKFRPYLHHYDGPKFRLELSRHEVRVRRPPLRFPATRDGVGESARLGCRGASSSGFAAASGPRRLCLRLLWAWRELWDGWQLSVWQREWEWEREGRHEEVYLV